LNGTDEPPHPEISLSETKLPLTDPLQSGML
jgi:hypothetical protein